MESRSPADDGGDAGVVPFHQEQWLTRFSAATLWLADITMATASVRSQALIV